MRTHDPTLVEPAMGPRIPVPRAALGLGLAVLVGLVVLVITHLGEAERFAVLLRSVDPAWLVLALGLQVGTYVFAGSVWNVVARFAGRPLRLRALARLSVVKLSVDQIIPSGGIAGNVVTVRSLARLGWPASVALEALLVEVLAYYGGFTLVTLVAVLVLWIHHDVTPVVVSLVAAFAVVAAAVPSAILVLLRHREWRPPRWLARRSVVESLLATVHHVVPAHVRSPRLLGAASILQVGVFVLDAATLWALGQAMGVGMHPLTAFVAVVVATIAATVSLLPGGLGSFEAGCTATLVLLGVSVEAALTCTLLLRGLTLWLPLPLGLVLARREITLRRAATPLRV